MKTHIAALTFALDKTTTNRVQLLPAGEFRSTDGRPAAPTKAWRTDSRVAAALATQMAARSNEVLIDYEHQSLLSRNNGQPAPAAGWFKGLDWVEGKGLYAANVRWTDKAKSHIQADEYQYVSCVFAYDAVTGEPQEIISAALTNTPALDGMDAVAALSATLALQPSPSLINQPLKGAPAMNLTPEQIAALTAAHESAKTKTEALTAELASANTQLAALKAERDALQAAQKAAADKAEAEKKAALITAALSGDKPLLAPAQKAWAEKLSLAALTEFLDASKPIAVTGTQAGHSAPNTAALSAEEQKFAEAMGVSPEVFAATRDGKPQPKSA